MPEITNKNLFSEGRPTNQRDAGAGGWSFRSLLLVLFRQKIHIIVFFLFTVISVIIFTLLADKVYQSDAKLFIQVGRESMSVDPAVVGPTMQVRSDRESELNSEAAALASKVLVEEVVAEIGAKTILGIANREQNGRLAGSVPQEETRGLLTRFLIWSGVKTPIPLNEIAVTRVLEKLSIGIGKQSHIINLGITSGNPHLAQTILEVLIDKYLDHHIEMHQAQAPPEFFAQRAERLKSALEEKEDQLSQFLEKSSLPSIEGQKAKVLDQVSQLQADFDLLVGLIGASKSKLQSIEQSLAERSPQQEISRVTGRPSRSLETLKEKLFELRSQETDLVAIYPDSNRALVDLREKIRLAEAQLSRESQVPPEITRGIDVNYQALQLSLANEQAELAALRSRHKILQSQIRQRQAQLLELSTQEIALKRIQREIDLANSEYQQYRENFQRARISADLDSGKISNVRVLQPPTLALTPVKPRKTLNVLLGIFFGLVGGIGLAFVREYLDQTLKTPEDVENRLALPVLTSISREEFDRCI